jgi:hypothetical protein
MASFTLTIPDAIVGTVTECLCKAGGFVPTGNATTDTANAKAAVIAWITQTVQNVQASELAPPAPPAPISGLS